MANKKIRATAELFLNTKDAKRDAKIFLDDLKGKLHDVENAADKMTVFKDMVSYIAQVDKALAALKENNKDAFAHMFDGIDVNLKKQLEGIFGVDGAKLSQLDILRDALGNLNLKSSISEIKGFAKELNNLFTSVGIDAPFKDINKEFFGRTNADHLQRLATELTKFATVWEGLNTKLAEGFNFGGGSEFSGNGTNKTLSKIEILISTIEKRNKELLDAKERFEKILKEFNDIGANGISDSYKTDLTTDSVKGLTVEYDNLFKELTSADEASEHFYDTLTKLMSVSLQLKKAFNDIRSNDQLKEQFVHASAGSGTGQSNMYALLSKYANDLNPVGSDISKKLNRQSLQRTVNDNNALIEELRTCKDINAVIQKRIDLYNQLSAKLHEYDELQRQEFDTDEEEDENLDRLAAIEREIKIITKSKASLETIQNVLSDLSEDGANFEDVMNKLYKTLGMETPDVFKERLDNLVEESKAAMAAMEDGSGTGVSGNGKAGSGSTVTAEVDFTSLEDAIRTEAASISDKLDNNIFKVELVKDQTKDIQNVINDIVANVQQISDHFHADQDQTDVNNMKNNLLQLLDVVNKHNAGRTSNGDYQRQELSALLMSDGSFSVNHGDKDHVAWGHVAETLLANLNKTLLGDFHSHPLRAFLSNGDTYVSDSFSGSRGDLGAWRYSQALGAQVAGMITGNILRVLDLSSIPDNIMERMTKNLANIEQQYLDSGRYSNYIGRTDDGRLAAKYQTTLEGRHEVTKVFESMMYDALRSVGYSDGYIDSQLFKKYNLTDDTQLTELATRLVKLVSSANQAVSPMERLAEIIKQFGYNPTSDKAKVLFEAYNKGEIKASDVFNKLSTDGDRVSEAAIQSLMNINSANQLSPVETLLTNIASVLSNINTIVGNIEANTRSDSENQLSSAIKSLEDLKAGIINDSLSRGVDSVYDGRDATNYRYQDTKIRAADAIKAFTDDLKIKSESEGFSFSESAVKDAFELVEKFKVAFTYLQDLGKQTDLFTGGRNDIGNYIDPASGKILDSYDTLSDALINNDTLDSLINYLRAIKDNQFGSTDMNDNQQFKSAFDGLYTIVDDLRSAISEFNGKQVEQKLPNMDNIFDDENNIDVSQDVTNLNNLLNKVQEVAGEVRGLATEVSGIISNISNVFNVEKESIVPKTNGEKSDLEQLQAQLVEVKDAVDAKTRAFEEEYVTVDAVVESEIASLQELINKLNDVVKRVGIVEASMKNINSNSVELNVGDSEAQMSSLLTSSNITSEISQLEKLQTQVIEVKNAVLSKTKAFVDEGSVVGQVVGKEISGLIKLEGIVNNISKKISELVQNITTLNQRGINFDHNSDATEVNARTPEEQFKIDKTAQKGALTKYLNSLKDAAYIVGDLEKKLNNLHGTLDIITDPSGLEGFRKAFADVKKEVDTARRRFEEIENKYVSSRKNSLTNAFNALNGDQQDELRDEYEATINKLQEYEDQIKSGQRVELSALDATISGIREKIKAKAELNQAARDEEKAQKKSAKFGDTVMINAKAKHNKLNAMATDPHFANSEKVTMALAEYNKAYEHLENVRNDINKKGEAVSSADEIAFKEAKDECNEYAKALKKIIDNSLKLSESRSNKDPYMLGFDFKYSNEESRKAALTDFAKEMYDVTLSTENFKNGFREAMFEINNGDGTFTKMTAKFTEARNEIVAMAGDTKKAQSAFGVFFDELKGKFKSIGAYLIASFSFHEVWSVIRQGVNYVKEIDSALTELKKVTDETDASYNRFLQDMAKTGNVIGATVKDLTIMASEWARLGYSMEEAGKLAKSTAILLNVSEFQDATAASEALISTMQAFQYTANESQHVVDILNEVKFTCLLI